MRIVLNAKTDCQNNIKEHDAFYWTIRLMGENGYKLAKNASTIKECVFQKDSVHYEIESTEWYIDTDNTVRLDVVQIRENKSLDQEYLNKDVLENVSYEIGENKVEITSDCTCFVRESKQEYPDIQNTLEAYKKLIKLCKDNGIKVSYSNHYKKLLTENKEAYINEVTNANSLFKSMIEVALNVQKRGIHYGCSDDIVLNNLHDIKSKYQAYHYRNTILRRVTEINHSIMNYIENIENEYSSYSKICL